MVGPCLLMSPPLPQVQPSSASFGCEKCTHSVAKQQKAGKISIWRKVLMEKNYTFPESQMKKKTNQPTLKPKLAESAVIYDIPYESNYRTSFKNFIKTVNLQRNVLGTICWQKPTVCRLTYGRTSLSRA